MRRGDQSDRGPTTVTGRPVGRIAAFALLLALFVFGLVPGTGSAHLGRVAVGVTTTTTTPDTTEAESTTEESSATTTESTTDEIAPVTTTTIQLTVPEGTTTGAGITPGGAAVVGAAAASTSDESSTQWGWIAFGILAAAVIIFGIVWYARRSRHA